jgi:betaine-aldehyde dehydrogenase
MLIVGSIKLPESEVPKLGMGDIRRRQLVEAAIAVIGEHGFHEATVQQIARRAGLSAGLVAHYFDDKEGLLEATLRALADELGQELVQAFSRAPDPMARVRAVIEVCLSPRQFEPTLARVWLAFWHRSLHSERLGRIQRVYQRRIYDNLLHALRPLVPATVAPRLAETAASLIDGVWLRSTLAEPAFGSRSARSAVLQAVETLIEAHALPAARAAS